MKISIFISLFIVSLTGPLGVYIYSSYATAQIKEKSQITSDKKKNKKSKRIKISNETCAEQDPGNTVESVPIGKHADDKLLRFAAFGDYGSDNNCELAVANLVKSFDPDLIITTGDNSYGSPRPGSIDDNIGKYYSDYIGNYRGTYGAGSPINRFFPTIGNHDDNDGDLSVYLTYFDLPGVGSNSSGNERYYDFVKGPVHFFAVNSTKETEPHGLKKTSNQARWLKQKLASSEAPWKIVYFHHSPYSSANHGSNTTLQWDFEDWGTTAVLSGHDHVYERILRDDNDDNVEMPYFVTGSGGHRSIYRFSNTLVDGSNVQYNSAHGALIVNATESNITFAFHSIENKGTLIDSYTIMRETNSSNVLSGSIGLDQIYGTMQK